MKTMWVLLLIGTASLSASDPVVGQPAVVTGLAGSLRIQQAVPCGNNIDQTTPAIGGRFELTPAEGLDVPGGRLFSLTRGNVFFAGFTITRSCLGYTETRTYTEVGVQVARAVSFTAVPVGPGVYSVRIPKGQFLIYEASAVNDKLETGSKRPSEDVTGTIDLAHGSVRMRVVLATRIHFRAGCTAMGCAIDEIKYGTLTANLSGTIVFPDADGDGVADRSDNCRFVANPDQKPVATPTIEPPPDITLASCDDRRIGFAMAADVCDAEPVTVTNDAPARFLSGTTTVTWTATDTSGNQSTARQLVTCK